MCRAGGWRPLLHRPSGLDGEKFPYDSRRNFMVPVKWVPDKLMWSNYKKVFEVLPFFTYYRNSLFIAALVVAGSMLTSSICAYGLARIKWKGKCGICLHHGEHDLPLAVTLIPTFLMWRRSDLPTALCRSLPRPGLAAEHSISFCCVSSI